MTRGLKRSQIGISEEMIQTYGEFIFEMSHNIQVRRGDAVRELDWEQTEATRAERGMSDAELARQFGLTHDQVTYIRTIMERRKFNRHNYHRLYDLGGGRRFRNERFILIISASSIAPKQLNYVKLSISIHALHQNIYASRTGMAKLSLSGSKNGQRKNQPRLRLSILTEKSRLNRFTRTRSVSRTVFLA